MGSFVQLSCSNGDIIVIRVDSITCLKMNDVTMQVYVTGGHVFEVPVNTQSSIMPENDYFQMLLGEST